MRDTTSPTRSPLASSNNALLVLNAGQPSSITEIDIPTGHLIPSHFPPQL